MHNYYVYILINQSPGTLYIGVTNDLSRRTEEHRTTVSMSFTQNYHLHKLVYFEQTEDIESAIAREKQLKNWHRQWKINLIEPINPNWEDLSVHYHMGPETSSG